MPSCALSLVLMCDSIFFFFCSRGEPAHDVDFYCVISLLTT